MNFAGLQGIVSPKPRKRGRGDWVGQLAIAIVGGLAVIFIANQLGFGGSSQDTNLVPQGVEFADYRVDDQETVVHVYARLWNNGSTEQWLEALTVHNLRTWTLENPNCYDEAESPSFHYKWNIDDVENSSGVIPLQTPLGPGQSKTVDLTLSSTALLGWKLYLVEFLLELSYGQGQVAASPVTIATVQVPDGHVFNYFEENGNCVTPVGNPTAATAKNKEVFALINRFEDLQAMTYRTFAFRNAVVELDLEPS